MENKELDEPENTVKLWGADLFLGSPVQHGSARCPRISCLVNAMGAIAQIETPKRRLKAAGNASLGLELGPSGGMGFLRTSLFGWRGIL